ncbi:MAG: carbohydrate kinase family protein [Anaerolineaceae bacterium]
MSNFSSPQFIIAGQLKRETILTPSGKAWIDIPGGNLLYAAAGFGIWEQGLGLVSRVGEDYPYEWLDRFEKAGFSTRGVAILPQAMDLRSFIAFTDSQTLFYDNPVSHFARAGQPFPRELLGYTNTGPLIDSRYQPTTLTLRVNELPEEYLDATAAHLCPMDYLSQVLYPPALRRGNITTITIDPSPGYMNSTFWDEIPRIIGGITAFITSEEKVRSLFAGRSVDLWEMAEALAIYGCEIVIVNRGENGFYLYDSANHSRWEIPAYQTEFIDPNGGNDAFCGGFLAGFRQSYLPLKAALLGSVSASLAVQGTGAFYPLDAMPGLAQARLEVLQEKVVKV